MLRHEASMTSFFHKQARDSSYRQNDKKENVQWTESNYFSLSFLPENVSSREALLIPERMYRVSSGCYPGLDAYNQYCHDQYK